MTRAGSRPRVGFVGVGWIGLDRMRAMLATGAVAAAAIVEPDPAAVARARAVAPDAAVLPDLDALLDHGVDGVVIATPSALHAAQAIRALSRGAAVFCQKPLGRDAGEAAAVVTAARAADRLLAVDLSYRFTAGMTRIRDLVRSGALGRVYAVDLVFHNAYGPDKAWFRDRALSGGGCVIDLGVHLVDLALWTLPGRTVTGVASRLFAGGRPLASATGPDDPVEDHAIATLDLDDGTVVRLACSWNLQAGCDAVIGATFHGTRGGAVLRNVDGSFHAFAADRFHGTACEPIAAPPDEWGGRAAADWARCLASGARHDPATAELVTVAAALDAIYEAAAVGPAAMGRPATARAIASASASRP